MLFPVISGDVNSWRWPHVVTQDVIKHTGNVKGSILVIAGEVKERTLLPVSPQAEVAADMPFDM